MPKITVDFSKVVANVVPEGDHYVSVHEVEIREGTDDPYIHWDLIITEGEYEGRHIFARTSLSKKSLWRLLDFVGALGFEEEIMDLEYDEETGVVLYPEFVGLVGIANVWHDSYQNRTTAQVDTLRPVDGSGPRLVEPGVEEEVEEEEFEEEEEEEVEKPTPRKKPKIKLK